MGKDNINHTSVVAESTYFAGKYSVGPHSIIGYSNGKLIGDCQFGQNATIGSFCIIESNVIVGDNCTIDHYCAIYEGALIGSNVKLIYGCKIYQDAKIGNNCIISGDIPERVVIENNVTFMGHIAHSYRDPTVDWDEAVESSPLIKSGTVIGVNALLVGGITIGSNCYIAAGETLRHNLPDNSVYINGKIVPLEYFRGFIKTRKNI